jgi:hypothetical protein
MEQSVINTMMSNELDVEDDAQSSFPLGFSFQDWGSDDMNMDNGVPVPIPSIGTSNNKTTALGSMPSLRLL